MSMISHIKGKTKNPKQRSFSNLLHEDDTATPRPSRYIDAATSCGLLVIVLVVLFIFPAYFLLPRPPQPHGAAKLRVEHAATLLKQARIDSGQDVLMGVNKYRLDYDDAPSSPSTSNHDNIELLQIDTTAVRREHIDRIHRVKASRDVEAVQRALDTLFLSVPACPSTSTRPPT
jgi:Methylmalonyl-CoA mutase